MFYSIRHITKFRYSNPVRQSVMEVRMQPRTEGNQRGLSFQLSVSPRARVFSYRDYLGNGVHHFDVPAGHNQLMIVAEALVDAQRLPERPIALSEDAWNQLDTQVAQADYQEMLGPSTFARPSLMLRELAVELKIDRRRDDPLTLLRQMSEGLFRWFSYVPQSTHVDSPIEDALRTRKGVCQDFAHIMIALVRNLRIPCRYVSGYLYHGKSDRDRSSDGATHAWVEALLPGLGWMGFDPTNNLIASERHIRTAIGRDYADVPPTRGIFQGKAESELTVQVRVAPSDVMPPPEDDLMGSEDWSTFLDREEEIALQQQQQQQQ